MNIEETFFFICLIIYFYKYQPHNFINNFINNYLINYYYIIDNSILKYNELLYPDYWDTFSETNSNLSDIISETINIVKEVKYEDKYLDIIRQIENKWVFTEDEINEKEKAFKVFYEEAIKNIKNEIDTCNELINTYKIATDEDSDNIKYIQNCNDYNDYNNYDDVVDKTTIEQRNEYRTEQIKNLNDKLNILNESIETDEGLNQIKSETEKQTENLIIDKRIDKLKNCYIMEKTPQGNVLMIYDKERETFKYYSDTNIPYRYLEVAARKYVKTFNCRPLFVDMEEELRLFHEKWTKEYELKKAKETEEKLKAEHAEKNKQTEQKKNVFAKFKSYNKDATGKISMAAPPKNSIPNKASEIKENEKILLKERANRYTYEGKFVNFNFLQKTEKKIFNKKLGITFADFKKMKK